MRAQKPHRGCLHDAHIRPLRGDGNKIASAHSPAEVASDKLSTAAERRDFPCGIIIAKAKPPLTVLGEVASVSETEG